MLKLKPANMEDIDEEYKAITSLPEEENGYMNPNYNVTYDEFKNKILPDYINHSKGIDIPDGKVPDTKFFLWDDDKIIGIFKVRHYLNDYLKEHGGHVGCSILPEYRGKGYGTIGLKLLLEECKNLIKEDEIYTSVLKTNIPSLKTQLKNNAYIHHEDDERWYVRIKIK